MANVFLDMLTGGAASKNQEAISAADTIGTGQRQQYGAQLANLTGAGNTQANMNSSPLGSLISTTATTMTGGSKYAATVSPYIQQMTALDFPTYLNSLLNLSGASSGSLVPFYQQQTQQRESAMSGLLGQLPGLTNAAGQNSVGGGMGGFGSSAGGGGGSSGFGAGGFMDSQGFSDMGAAGLA